MSGTTTAEFSESHDSAHESSDNQVLIKQDLSKKDCSGPPNDLHSEPSVPIAQAEVQTFSQKTDIQADAQTDPAQAHSTNVAVIATVVATPADVQTNMCKFPMQCFLILPSKPRTIYSLRYTNLAAILWK